jgi:hypothetical protein
MKPLYPEVHVCVADNAPLHVIIDRVDAAMRKAKISAAQRCEFRARVPHTYALGIDFIRNWVSTD